MSCILEVLHCHKKGAHLNTIERFHIHTEFVANKHLNDSQTIFLNTAFYTLIKTHCS